jgi:A/G-specific adenine glycosylase
MPRPGRLSTALLAWYDRGRRDLPWRRDPSAYRTLVSEFMLQQTVVATVIPYFERFMARVPDVAALAAAAEEEVLGLWAGLGYYSRARNLHRAARVVVDRHGGRLPADEAALRALPGIGEYTAAAIAAIAHGVPTFALDGNAARVVARLAADDGPIDRPEVRTRLRAAGQAFVPRDRPGDFAQAVMELGARVCTPRAPRCPECPVAPHCAARAQDRQGTLPVRSPRRAKTLVRLGCAVVERRGRLLLVRRPDGGLLAGTWALPSAEASGGRGADVAIATLAAVTALGLSPRGAARALGAVRHVFTHRDVTAEVFGVDVAGALRAEVDARWVTRAELAAGALPLSSFTRKTLLLAGG